MVVFFMLRGIKVGVTNLVALGEDRKPLYRVDVHVTTPTMVRVISGNNVSTWNRAPGCSLVDGKMPEAGKEAEAKK
jgi:hypothetical protein